MDPMNIDAATGIRVAIASSHDEGRVRWTELSVFYFAGQRRHWMAQVDGCSTVPGERLKRQRLASASMERALSLFGESDLATAVRAHTREAAEEFGLLTVPARPNAYRRALERMDASYGLGAENARVLIDTNVIAKCIHDCAVRALMKQEEEFTHG